MLSRALSVLLDAIILNLGLFSLHSLWRGRATTVYRQGLDYLDIKHQGLGSSNSLWTYVTSSCTATSPVMAGLAAAIQATASSFQEQHPNSPFPHCQVSVTALQSTHKLSGASPRISSQSNLRGSCVSPSQIHHCCSDLSKTVQCQPQNTFSQCVISPSCIYPSAVSQHCCQDCPQTGRCQPQDLFHCFVLYAIC